MFSSYISSYIGNCTIALWYKIKSGRSIKLNPIELFMNKPSIKMIDYFYMFTLIKQLIK